MFVVYGSPFVPAYFHAADRTGRGQAAGIELKIKKERSIASTRGNIYDVNGIALAYNELSSSVTIEDVYESSKKKCHN